MEKPIVVAMTAVLFLAGSAFILPATFQVAHAQYAPPTGTPGAGGEAGGIEEQLQLAKEKISNAESQGAYGSGTPMLGANISETIIFIGILAAIFGGVAAAFFIRSRTARKAPA
jgi:hypothetical protein